MTFVKVRKEFCGRKKLFLILKKLLKIPKDFVKNIFSILLSALTYDVIS